MNDPFFITEKNTRSEDNGRCSLNGRANLRPLERIFEYTFSSGEEGMTIEQFLRSRGYSHHLLTQLKRTREGICLNHVWAYANQKPAAGDLLTVRLTEQGSGGIVPAPVPFSIVYEDEDLVVVNKPADTPIHPSQNNYDNTLANGMAWYFQQKGLPFTYRCINRLDRDTTGLLIIAKHGLSAAVLSAQMREREISRTYEALVFGALPSSGTIRTPIGRKEGSTIERIPDPVHGEPAVTHFETLRQCGSFSHVRLKLETGRTHQIRVHMTSIGHPLLGDTLYAPGRLHPIGRQALHSAALEFCHPVTGLPLRFLAPLPDDMRGLLECP